MIRKISLLILVFFILFIQVNIHADLSCNVTASTNERVIQLGCLGDDCYFRIFRESNVNLGFSSCESNCIDTHVSADGSYFYESYRSCIENCISSNVTNPQPIKKQTNLIFTTTACTNKKTHLELGADLELEIRSNTNSLKLSGVTSLYTNGNDITLYVLNTNQNFNKTFDLDLDLVGSGNYSNLKVIDEPLTETKNGSQNTIEVKVKDLIVKENSYFYFNFFGKKPVDYDSEKSNREAIESHSENFKLNLNNIYNYGNLNIDLKTGDGKKGRDGVRRSGVTPSSNYSANNGGLGGDSGDLIIDVNTINNYGDLFFDLKTGKSGNGGKGLDQRRRGIAVQMGHGGDAGNAGSVFLNILNINNYSNFNFNVESGDGGDGGNTGRDKGSSRNKHGGDGGNGGSVIFGSIDYLKNNGNFIIEIKAGDGGDGGRKVRKTSSGNQGNGGNGGSFKLLQINILENNNSFNLNVLDGLYGIRGLTGRSGFDGFSSNEMDFKINYLINRTHSFNINLFTYRVNVSSNRVIIERLENGSYLPNKIFTKNKSYVSNRHFPGLVECEDTYGECFEDCEEENVVDGGCKDISDDDEKEQCLENCDNNCLIIYDACVDDLDTPYPEYTSINLDNREIIVNNGCYIRRPIQAYDYIANMLVINSANSNDFKEFIPQSFSGNNLFLSENLDCAICDFHDLKEINIFPQNTNEKFFRNYTLYSNSGGQINPGDLKINYTRNTSNFQVIPSYNPFLNQIFPLYENKETIVSEFDEDLGLYKFPIISDKLMWYYDRDLDLTDKELFCYYQNYRVEGTITGQGESKNFNFPFTPIFKFVN